MKVGVCRGMAVVDAKVLSAIVLAATLFPGSLLVILE